MVETFPCLVDKLIIANGSVNGKPVKCMRDTGSTVGIIRASLVEPEALLGVRRTYMLVDGTLRESETAVVQLECPFFSGAFECLVVNSPPCDVVVGNVAGATGCEPCDVGGAVLTRRMAAKEGKPPKPLLAPQVGVLQVSLEDLCRMQHESDDLETCFKLAESGESRTSGRSGTVRFEIRRGLLMRIYSNKAGLDVNQVVVPQPLRNGVLELSHDAVMAGHLGTSKSLDRLSQGGFYWPGVGADMTRFVRSCDVCQRVTPKGRVKRVPLQKVPVVGTPFRKVAIDLIGPINPMASSGNRFVLCLVDYATRYPEAIALKGISTEEVAEALTKSFSRVGIPSTVLSDQGSQFVGEVTQEVFRLLSVDHVTSSIYHPQANGLVEKWNATLKSMLRKLCAERPTDWDRYIEPALFAYREVPQDSVGFSPFEMLYGRTVRGPLAILKELWTKEIPDEEVQSTYRYVFELRNRLEETCKLVRQTLLKNQKR